VDPTHHPYWSAAIGCALLLAFVAFVGHQDTAAVVRWAVAGVLAGVASVELHHELTQH